MANELTVVIGGKGKTGGRVVERLQKLGHPVRVVSPSAEVTFDWHDPRTWERALTGATRLYLTYYPDLAMPGAAEQVDALCQLAVRLGVAKIVLLAGRGEPQVHPAEDAVRRSGAAWTILECAFFMQNMTEGLLAPEGDVVAFPGGQVLEPFIDCDDIADVAVAALLDRAHDGQTYELTGPQLLTFRQATEILGDALGRPLRYLPITFEEYGAAMQAHLPAPAVAFFIDLFQFLLDGHNARTTDDVQRVLGRPARDYKSFALRFAEVTP